MAVMRFSLVASPPLPIALAIVSIPLGEDGDTECA